MKTVFISYSTKDRAVAAKVRAALEAHGIKVTIDSESLAAGGNIRAFIDQSIWETEVTLSIVSRSSLESDWVALESVESFAAEKQAPGKKFIACYIDDQFLNRSFLIEAIGRIDREIDELGEQIARLTELNVDTPDLQTIKSRKFKLRNNLSEILDRLRGSLTLDIREPEFERSLQRIVAEINRVEDGEGPGSRGRSGGTTRREASSPSQSNAEEVIKYHHLCDRQEQVVHFRDEVAAYLAQSVKDRPLIFFIHGGKNDAFDHIFTRLEGELREELENCPGREGLEKHQWASPPKPGSSQEAICESYVRWRYRAYGKKAEEHRSTLTERLRNSTGAVQLVQLKWTSDNFSRQPAEEVEPLLRFARSWYSEASMPVIWLIGIEYGPVRSLESILRMKFSKEKKIREWLAGFSVKSADRVDPDSPVTLAELREVTMEEVDHWRQGAGEKLGFDLDRMLKLEADIQDYFRELKRTSVDMSTLIGKLRQLTA